MKIGTLSFELRGDQMALDSFERIQIIKDVAQKYNPDFILCAGWSLEHNSDLASLKSELDTIGSKTTIVVEVKKDDKILNGEHPLKKEIPEWDDCQHKLFAIVPNKKIVELGPQFFGTSADLKSKSHGKILLNTFENNYHNRTFFIGKHRGTALCCGEINVFNGRDNITSRSELVKKAIFDADIVVNPTHDGMANYGTLKAKRRYLSKNINGSNRCYISSSNWNTSKSTKKGVISQSPSRDTLHSVYLNGEKQITKRYPDPDGRYEFRLAEIRI